MSTMSSLTQDNIEHDVDMSAQVIRAKSPTLSELSDLTDLDDLDDGIPNLRLSSSSH
jgi:hypothetical protein